MPSLAKRMSDTHNRKIAGRIGEQLAYGSVFVTGFFYKQYREIQFDDGKVDAVDLSFDCSYSDVNTLAQGDAVEIFADEESLGHFEVRRFAPDGGDESNWVTIVLQMP